MWQVPPYNNHLPLHYFLLTLALLPQSGLHLLSTCFCFDCLLLPLELALALKLALAPSRAILQHNCFDAQESRISCGHDFQSALDLYRDRLCFTEEVFNLQFYCRQVTKINARCYENLNSFVARCALKRFVFLKLLPILTCLYIF